MFVALIHCFSSSSKHSDTSFSSCLWPTAKDLINQLLKTDPNERMTITQFMNHPWISVRTCVAGVVCVLWSLLSPLLPVFVCVCRDPWWFPPLPSTPPESWQKTERCGRTWRWGERQHWPLLVTCCMAATASNTPTVAGVDCVWGWHVLPAPQGLLFRVC